VLVERFQALRATSLEPAEAERRVFAEYLANADIDPDELSTLYQDFLAACAPASRRERGVFYTPLALVRAQVRLVDGLLKDRLGATDGFADARVVTVDPAAGSGAYPLAIVEQIPDAANVLQRMRLFEPMPGAAAIARARGLPIEERDALSAQLKLDAPIVVCLGNPPYRRRPRVMASPVALDGFARGVRGVHLKNLYNDYVYFWRWALQVAIETRTGPAVVCFVSAASYLRGPAFSGFRETLLRLLDELWVLDLEGDHRAARPSHNVFSIRTPVAIALGVRRAEPATLAPARVHYARLTGSRDDKLAVLDGLRTVRDVEWREVGREPGEPLVPIHHSEYFNWPALTELFPWQLSGAQLKRTWPIGVTPDVLRERWRHLLALPPTERWRAFGPTRDRDVNSEPTELLDAACRLGRLVGLPPDSECKEPVRYAYRAFDRHWVLPDSRLGDFMRPSLWRVGGPGQVYLTSMLTNVVGPGPAAVATAFVPDLDHFRGSFGARGVIPLWCDASAGRPNVADGLLARLSDRYGYAVDAPALMAYCYALLATRGFARRFQEELRTPGPRVPITLEAGEFLRGASLGESLIALHTYRHVAVGEARLIEAVGDSYPRTFAYEPEYKRVIVGRGCVEPIRREMWDYRVSGYPVLAGWLRQRVSMKTRNSPLDAIVPMAWTPALSDELLELVWLLEATLKLESQLDAFLGDAVSSSGGQ
jgi:hypothetical protein